MNIAYTIFQYLAPTAGLLSHNNNNIILYIMQLDMIQLFSGYNACDLVQITMMKTACPVGSTIQLYYGIIKTIKKEV